MDGIVGRGSKDDECVLFQVLRLARESWSAVALSAVRPTEARRGDSRGASERSRSRRQRTGALQDLAEFDRAAGSRSVGECGSPLPPFDRPEIRARIHAARPNARGQGARGLAHSRGKNWRARPAPRPILPRPFRSPPDGRRNRPRECRSINLNETGTKRRPWGPVGGGDSTRGIPAAKRTN